MIRSLVLFTHVVGVLALFVGLGLEWIGLDGIQRSTTRAEALPWLRLIAIVPRLFGTALAAIVVSGFYLGARVGVLGNDWMRASYGALLLMAIVSGPVSRSPMRALKRVADVPADTPKMIPPAGTWHWVRTTDPPEGIWNEFTVVAAVTPDPRPTNRADGPPLVTTRSRLYPVVGTV